jgi:hypothetical protein
MSQAVQKLKSYDLSPVNDTADGNPQLLAYLVCHGSRCQRLAAPDACRYVANIDNTGTEFCIKPFEVFAKLLSINIYRLHIELVSS